MKRSSTSKDNFLLRFGRGASSSDGSRDGARISAIEDFRDGLGAFDGGLLSAIEDFRDGLGAFDGGLLSAIEDFRDGLDAFDGGLLSAIEDFRDGLDAFEGERFRAFERASARAALTSFFPTGGPRRFFGRHFFSLRS